MAERRKYKKYLKNPEATIPATTAWRQKKMHTLPASTCSSSSPPKKRRKLYCRIPSSVPRQTLHYWNSEESNCLPECSDNQLSEHDDYDSYEMQFDGSELCNDSDSEHAASEKNLQQSDQGNDKDQSDSDECEQGDSELEEHSYDESLSDTEGSVSEEESQQSEFNDSDDAEDSEVGESSNSDNNDVDHVENGQENAADHSVDRSESPAVYPGAPISEEASWLSIYQFAVANHLTDKATQQLLSLIRIHCPPSNSCPSTLHKLKKKLGVVNSTNLQYCSNCMEEVPKERSKCVHPACKKSSQLCYFSILPFEKHLHTIFTDNWDAVQYPFTRNSATDRINDIQDGSKYKRLFEKGNFLSIPEHTGLVLFCDGVPLFKSSGPSLWPIILSCTSLPPDVRMKTQYLMLGGVWLGPVKPKMDIILSPIIETINNIDLPLQGRRNLRAMLLLAVFDLPAKAMALNCIQFNGTHGCPYCLDQGLARAKSVPTRTYSHEVVTLWYRPPDVLMGSTVYFTPLDMWGVGCIFVEMLTGKPLFPGIKGVYDQLNKIWSVLGTPQESTWPGVSAYPDYKPYHFIKAAPRSLERVSPMLSPSLRAGNLASKVLRLIPSERISASDALAHEYFSSLPKSIFSISDSTSIFLVPGVSFHR